MLSKNNKILIGCLALLLVMSVGYALFSDTITINGTATAKGDFDITAMCEPGISSKVGTVNSLGLSSEGGYENDTCSTDGDNISVNVGFLYPGAKRYFTYKFTNTGTIDAVLNLSNRKFTNQTCVADNIQGENLECTSASFYKGFTVTFRSLYKDGYDTIKIEDDKGNILTNEQAQEFLDLTNGVLTLKPGYSIYNVNVVSVDHIVTYNTNEMFVNYTATDIVMFEQAQ